MTDAPVYVVSNGIEITAIGSEEIACRTCGTVFPTPPRSKAPCIHCGERIYHRSRCYDGKKVFLSESEALNLERQWAAFQELKALLQFASNSPELAQMYESLMRGQMGRTPLDYEIIDEYFAHHPNGPTGRTWYSSKLYALYPPEFAEFCKRAQSEGVDETDLEQLFNAAKARHEATKEPPSVIHRLSTLAGRPFVIDARKLPWKIDLTDGAQRHRFTYAGLGKTSDLIDQILTREGPTLQVSPEVADSIAKIGTASTRPTPRPSSPVPQAPLPAPSPADKDGVMTVDFNGYASVTYDGDVVTLMRKHGVHRGEKKILVSQISSIQMKEPGFLAGYIQFVFSGSSETKSGTWDAAQDENTITFRGKAMTAQFKAMRDAILQRAAELKGGKSKPAEASVADEIEKLAGLRDRGILTEDEFAAKKRQLLGLI